jgi:hypothetical protein
MGRHNFFTSTLILRIRFCCFLFCLLGPLQTPPIAQDRARTTLDTQELMGVVRAQLNEERFWDIRPTGRTDSTVVLFIRRQQPEKTLRGDFSDFDALAILPELNLTFEYQICGNEPFLVVGSGSSSTAPIEAKEYLATEEKRMSEFIAQAKEFTSSVQIQDNAADLFKVEPEFERKRIEQIKLALKTYVHKRPVTIRIAKFSKFTKQIAALAPSLGQMFMVSVVNRTCGQESVEIGKIHSLKSVRAELRSKIDANSIPAVLH